MEDGKPKTEFEGIAAQFAAAKAKQEREEAQGLRNSSTDAKIANKRRELQFKSSHSLLVAFFFLIGLLHVLGIYLFTTGFLLTRLVLDDKSECAVPPTELQGSFVAGSPENGCWHPKTFKKAVVIIVDALRYDFTVPFHPTEDDSAPHHFHNAIPIFYETASQQPNNAFLLPFISDPPTTTLQRLKGLTTGTLPTFIDAGSNFAGTAIEEDNLIGQLRNASKNIVHLGDDTWHSLFPGYFDPELTRPYDSFNVWDLHTVDDGVTEHLFPYIQPEYSQKWDVLIGHYLGVDHAGHRYGPDHPAMTAKLQQMDDVFRKVIKVIDDETLLVVMGDHGMDSKGDHGGESEDEVEAALWMYSKKGIFGRSSPEFVTPPATAKERPLAQIDLVPTLSLLLGLPIPFNSLGKPIEEAFVGRHGDDFQNLALVNRLAASQIHRYQHEYALAKGLDEADELPRLTLWKAANKAWEAVKQTKRPTPHHFKQAYEKFASYQKLTLSRCRSLWAEFHVVSMFQGIGILAWSLAILVIYARGVDGDQTDLTPLLLFRGVSGFVFGVAGGAGVGFLIPFFEVQHSAIFGAAVFALAGLSSSLVTAKFRVSSPFPRSFWGSISVVLPSLLSIGFASNSFTIWEDEILMYFLCTFGVLFFASSMRQEAPEDRILGCTQSVIFVILARVASFSRLCREEQMPFCKSTYYASSTSSTSAIWQLAIPFLLSAALPEIVKTFYNRTRSFQSMAQFWLGFSFRVCLLLSALFWAFDAADDMDYFEFSKQSQKGIRVVFSRVTFGIALGVGYVVYAWCTPLLKIETHEAKPSDANDPAVVSQGGRTSIIILGYANIHGSRYALLITAWALAVIHVQKPMGGGSLAVLLWQIFCLLEIVDTNKLSNTAVGPTVLALLGSFHFFKTGHQATLSSIQWESAFLPFKSIHYPWSPLLVILNTFGAQILAAVAVPATALWKQPPKKKGLLGDVAQAVATHMLFYAGVALATTCWAGHLRRHLMLYRIFSPRFMMAALVLIVVDVVSVFVGIGGTWWSFLSNAEVFGWL
ncbi:Type I phosphodiesterase/nucleotide pyrophosphatase/phosphate transferase [Botryosphaeria dothidea]|uniref:Type I phosphodiesterase/nucleotide pyrophosphatase/phosphate transferase n=1 Tax=Botryosphaeria dothidea TaxID=55169 RepID=A0A8H4IM16_9PEZI|nr:Type I phosphodiesterase/nucleotide pyrophosphatase/phosphate transferase [Botryosphaeria dothidea]